MPNPKDPQKLQEYREKLRQIALERGFGKWMKGRKIAPEAVEKMRQAQIEIGNDPEERKRRSERAKAGGYGKWMQGRTLPTATREKIGRWSRGRTYDELYGDDAAEQRKARRETNRITGIQRKKPHVRPKHNGEWQYTAWRTAVFGRDDFTCQKCKVRGGILHAHHIKAWATHPESRYDISNGITYCVKCHKEEHKAA